MLNVNLYIIFDVYRWLMVHVVHASGLCLQEKHQYMKSNEILTTVIKEAYQNNRISDILKEGIEAF